jgi:2-polyprenyl-3-methyl-5-hydroxy-6-metoxy-1,4-benzoquinol methylase
MNTNMPARSVGLQKYKHLYMLCAPGTHEAAAGLLLKHTGPRAGVLDLAAGTGALLLRLKDAGFSDLHATELDPAKFGPVEGVTPRVVDLNTDFAAPLGRRFGVVLAIEIIEHLESPRHFLSQVRELMEDDGLLLLSTPNVADWIGRLKFLFTGELRYFTEWHYRRNGHISPLTDTQLRLLLKETGFGVIDATTAGSFFGPAKRVMTAPLRWMFHLIGGRRTSGDVNVYLLAKAPIAMTAEQRNAIYYLK